jgi:hypothetical protein
MVPLARERVSENTADSVNQRIQQETEASVAYYAAHREEIDARLNQLEGEWDIERVLEANAAGIGFAGVMLGAFVDRRWLALPAAVTGFLMQHAVQGWCPPVPVFRRMGVRTMAEIDAERYALKVLRGDFGEPGAAQQTGPDMHRLARNLLHAVSR